MSPLTLFLVIAAAVACGIVLAPYIGTIAAIMTGLVLAGIALMIGFAIVKGLFRESVSLVASLSAGIRIYFRAIPRAWSMLFSPTASGERGQLHRRLDGLVVLLVCLVWAVVIVGFAVLLLFPTHARV